VSVVESRPSAFVALGRKSTFANVQELPALNTSPAVQVPGNAANALFEERTAGVPRVTESPTAVRVK
jgi:hypothetical protein